MTWYNPRTWEMFEKANRAQETIASGEGTAVYTTAPITYQQAFKKIEVVRRGVNLIVDACSSLDFDVKDKIYEGVVTGSRQKAVLNLLNFRPNPYQSAQEFRSAIFTDYILEGNIFMYYDGMFLYHLPANKVEVNPDPKTFVAGYKYNGTTPFAPNEIIHIKDLSSDTIYRGSSRLEAASRSIKILYNMQKFQDQFFENGAVPGLVLHTENTLSQVAKDKTIQNWQRMYSPTNGARRPMIIDSGLKVDAIFNTNFKELDFDASIQTHDTRILEAMGVPPILLNGGNNANISPNLRLFYLETVLPIVRNYVSAMERFFGYDVEAITSSVSALQPDIKEIASYHTTLVNGGILSPNEARIELRYEKKPGLDEIRVPANIAGSAADPSQGGAPKKDPPKA